MNYWYDLPFLEDHLMSKNIFSPMFTASTKKTKIQIHFHGLLKVMVGCCMFERVQKQCGSKFYNRTGKTSSLTTDRVDYYPL